MAMGLNKRSIRPAGLQARPAPFAGVAQLGTLSAMAVARAHVRVSGVVQGIGFRWFALRLAERYGLVGWVRNRADGSVEAEAEGERGAVEGFLREIEAGPRFGHVESASVDWISPRHDPTFEVRR